MTDLNTLPRKPASPPPPAPKRASVVTVGCKIPNGLQLQLQREEVWTEETREGSRERKRWQKYGDVYIVRGPMQPVGQAPAGYHRPVISHTFALTPNIPAHFWDQWLEQNKDTDIVQGGFIFAHATHASVAAEAKEKRELMTGLEPLRPDEGDRRMPRPITGQVAQISTAQEWTGEFFPEGEPA